jgi:uncharacterized integral membrane protein (TIGR00697 family)
VKRDTVYFILSGFFITNALLGELAGAKLIDIGPFTNTVGVIPWPVIFISTDLISEYFGKEGVKRLTYLTVGLIAYSFVLLNIMIYFPTSPASSLSHDVYKQVFSQSNWVIVASLIAFIISQFIDIGVFWFLRHRTGSKMLWLRATGSTAVSQIFDTVVILAIGFWLPGKWDTHTFIKVCISNYTYKLLVAVMITPLIYAAHSLIDRFLGEAVSHAVIEKTAKEN